MKSLNIYDSDGICRYKQNETFNEAEQPKKRSLSSVQRRKVSKEKCLNGDSKENEAQRKQRRKKIKRALPRKTNNKRARR